MKFVKVFVIACRELYKKKGEKCSEQIEISSLCWKRPTFHEYFPKIFMYRYEYTALCTRTYTHNSSEKKNPFYDLFDQHVMKGNRKTRIFHEVLL